METCRMEATRKIIGKIGRTKLWKTEGCLMSNTNYSGWLWEDSKHSVNRAKERAGMNRKKALKMMELARKRGITSDECKWSLV